MNRSRFTRCQNLIGWVAETDPMRGALVITGTGPGPGAEFGPHARAFIYGRAAVPPAPGVNFFSFGTNKWEVNICAEDLDGDGIDEILAGSGPGPSHEPGINVNSWDRSTLTMIHGFTPYPDDDVTHGVKVAIGEFDV